jgi:hypothetical protein
MTDLEDRLRRSLGSEDEPLPPSPDLFARVLDDIDDDRGRRRRRSTALLAGSLLLCATTVAVLTLTPRTNGDLAMPWWILEVATTAVLVAIALWLGPFIKRFGRAYAADVFHDNPMTGKSYIVLADIVYYLIFAAYILFTVNFQPGADWAGTVGAAQFKVETARLGGILLIIGVLHGANIVVMPVLGRLFSLNRHLSGSDRR